MDICVCCGRYVPAGSIVCRRRLAFLEEEEKELVGKKKKENKENSGKRGSKDRVKSG